MRRNTKQTFFPLSISQSLFLNLAMAPKKTRLAESTNAETGRKVLEYVQCGRADRHTDGPTDRQTETYSDIQTDAHARTDVNRRSSQTQRRTGRQTDRQRQRDRHTCTH